MKLLVCEGGSLELPTLVLNDREDGGHLVVQPPRPVWDRTELTRIELAAFSFLAAASAAAMMTTLPQLDGGCINYWDAGNWALNDDAAPAGPKRGSDFRQLHLHLFGRSQHARNPAWRWGEAPHFPVYTERVEWAATLRHLSEAECVSIAGFAAEYLASRYGIQPRSCVG